MKIWVPVFVWVDHEGKRRYDVHGVEDQMVSNRDKRKRVSGDVVSVFMSDASARPGKYRARLRWARVEVEDPPGGVQREVARYECCDGACPGHVFSGEACYP